MQQASAAANAALPYQPSAHLLRPPPADPKLASRTLGQKPRYTVCSER